MGTKVEFKSVDNALEWIQKNYNFDEIINKLLDASNFRDLPEDEAYQKYLKIESEVLPDEKEKDEFYLWREIFEHFSLLGGPRIEYGNIIYDWCGDMRDDLFESGLFNKNVMEAWVNFFRKKNFPSIPLRPQEMESLKFTAQGSAFGVPCVSIRPWRIVRVARF